MGNPQTSGSHLTVVYRTPPTTCLRTICNRVLFVSAVKTGCVAVIAVATRIGLDGREPAAGASTAQSYSDTELETASPTGVTAPRAFPLDGRKSTPWSTHWVTRSASS